MNILKPASVRQEARKKLAGVWHIPVLFYIIATTVISVINISIDSDSTIMSSLVSLLIMLIVIDLADRKDDIRTFKATLDRVTRNKALGNVIMLGVVVYIKIILWTLLFIIPGIYKFYEYSQSYYICYEAANAGKPKKIKQCISESKQMMNGNKMNLFLVHLSLFGWAIMYLVVLFGVFYFGYVEAMSTTLFFGFLSIVFGGFYFTYVQMIQYTFHLGLKSMQADTDSIVDTQVSTEAIVDIEESTEAIVNTKEDAETIVDDQQDTYTCVEPQEDYEILD